MTAAISAKWRFSSPVMAMGGSRSQSVVKIRFETTVELDITAIDIVGLDQKGGRRVLMTVSPQHGTTGVGATYAIDVPRNIFKDTKQVQIVLQPSGEGSNLLEAR